MTVLQFPPSSATYPPLGTPEAPSPEGASGRLAELRDMLASFCLNEARKLHQNSHSTPASIVTVRELARVAGVVLAIEGPSLPIGDSPVDFGRFTPEELESYRRLRDKAGRGAA